jgi:hypothetical protein
VTDWYAPNQQAVRSDGSGPAEEGTGGDAGVDASTAAFDPGAATVDEVKAYVEAHPDETEAVHRAEVSGKNRSTLVAWLEEHG